MPLEKLTALAVERVHRKGSIITMGDGGGLYFRKQTPTGAAWMLRYRFAGKPKWMALGNFPDMSLAQARKEARAQRVLLDTQRDPLTERRAARAREVGRQTFAALAEDWFAVEILGRKLKHPEVPRRYLDKYLLPRLRHKKADEVVTDDLTLIVDSIKGKKPAAANDLLRYGIRIMDFGLRRRRIHANPWAGLIPSRDGGGTERARQRSLRFDELASLFQAMRDAQSFSQVNELLAKLLLALLVRKGQLLAAKRSEFDLEGKTKQGPVWRMPASRGKMEKISIDVPLVPQVVSWLRRAEVLAGRDEYMFPRLRRDSRQRVPHMGVDTLNAALAELRHGVEHFTVHDLRRTARTHLAELGIRREVAERCLSHKIKGMEGVYDTHPYFVERREALELWTDVLITAERGGRKKHARRKAA